MTESMTETMTRAPAAGHTMTTIDPSAMEADAIYKLMVGIVVPRPIAWIVTLSPTGVVNLAPFSAFTFVSQKPPMIGISVGRNANGYKDTSENILANQEYVTHIADTPLLDPLHQSSIDHPPDVSEVGLLGLATTPSELVRPPRLTAAPIALECRLHRCIEFGEIRSRFIVGEIVRMHVRHDLISDGKIDSKALDPICRLGGPRYARLGEVITMQPLHVPPRSGR